MAIGNRPRPQSASVVIPRLTVPGGRAETPTPRSAGTDRSGASARPQSARVQSRPYSPHTARAAPLVGEGRVVPMIVPRPQTARARMIARSSQKYTHSQSLHYDSTRPKLPDSHHNYAVGLKRSMPTRSSSPGAESTRTIGRLIPRVNTQVPGSKLLRPRPASARSVPSRQAPRYGGMKGPSECDSPRPPQVARPFSAKAPSPRTTTTAVFDPSPGDPAEELGRVSPSPRPKEGEVIYRYITLPLDVVTANPSNMGRYARQAFDEGSDITDDEDTYIHEGTSTYSMSRPESRIDASRFGWTDDGHESDETSQGEEHEHHLENQGRESAGSATSGSVSEVERSGELREMMQFKDEDLHHETRGTFRLIVRVQHCNGQCRERGRYATDDELSHSSESDSSPERGNRRPSTARGARSEGVGATGRPSIFHRKCNELKEVLEQAFPYVIFSSTEVKSKNHNECLFKHPSMKYDLDGDVVPGVSRSTRRDAKITSQSYIGNPQVTDVPSFRLYMTSPDVEPVRHATKVGCFEVTVNLESNNVHTPRKHKVVHSRVGSRMWPSGKNIVEQIRDFVRDSVKGIVPLALASIHSRCTPQALHIDVRECQLNGLNKGMKLMMGGLEVPFEALIKQRRGSIPASRDSVGQKEDEVEEKFQKRILSTSDPKAFEFVAEHHAVSSEDQSLVLAPSLQAGHVAILIRPPCRGFLKVELCRNENDESSKLSIQGVNMQVVNAVSGEVMAKASTDLMGRCVFLLSDWRRYPISVQMEPGRFVEITKDVIYPSGNETSVVPLAVPNHIVLKIVALKRNEPLEKIHLSLEGLRGKSQEKGSKAGGKVELGTAITNKFGEAMLDCLTGVWREWMGPGSPIYIRLKGPSIFTKTMAITFPADQVCWSPCIEILAYPMLTLNCVDIAREKTHPLDCAVEVAEVVLYDEKDDILHVGATDFTGGFKHTFTKYTENELHGRSFKYVVTKENYFPYVGECSFAEGIEDVTERIDVVQIPSMKVRVFARGDQEAGIIDNSVFLDDVDISLKDESASDDVVTIAEGGNGNVRDSRVTRGFDEKLSGMRASHLNRPLSLNIRKSGYFPWKEDIVFNGVNTRELRDVNLAKLPVITLVLTDQWSDVPVKDVEIILMENQCEERYEIDRFMSEDLGDGKHGLRLEMDDSLINKARLGDTILFQFVHPEYHPADALIELKHTTSHGTDVIRDVKLSPIPRLQVTVTRQVPKSELRMKNQYVDDGNDVEVPVAGATVKVIRNGNTKNPEVSGESGADGILSYWYTELNLEKTSEVFDIIVELKGHSSITQQVTFQPAGSAFKPLAAPVFRLIPNRKLTVYVKSALDSKPVKKASVKIVDAVTKKVTLAQGRANAMGIYTVNCRTIQWKQHGYAPAIITVNGGRSYGEIKREIKLDDESFSYTWGNEVIIDITLTKTPPKNQIHAVLTWCQVPNSLQLNCVCPSGEIINCYSGPSSCGATVTVENDDIDGFGPLTFSLNLPVPRIKNVPEHQYHFFAHRNSTEYTMWDSHAAFEMANQQRKLADLECFCSQDEQIAANVAAVPKKKQVVSKGSDDEESGAIESESSSEPPPEIHGKFWHILSVGGYTGAVKKINLVTDSLKIVLLSKHLPITVSENGDGAMIVQRQDNISYDYPTETTEQRQSRVENARDARGKVLSEMMASAPSLEEEQREQEMIMNICDSLFKECLEYSMEYAEVRGSTITEVRENMWEDAWATIEEASMPQPAWLAEWLLYPDGIPQEGSEEESTEQSESGSEDDD